MAREPTSEEVEAVAKAMFVHEHKGNSSMRGWTWEKERATIGDYWIAHARAAIAAYERAREKDGGNG